MQAIILAAGCGTRLVKVLQGKPKCLAPLTDEVNLLKYQVAVLNSIGIDEICLVLGYHAHEIYREIGDSCHCIINHRYAETNSLYSLWLARKWVQGDCLIMNSDILAHPRIYKRLLKKAGNAVAYDSWSGHEEEHMKVTFSPDAQLQQINKTMSCAASQGESTGLLKFTQAGMTALFQEAEMALRVGGENQWAPAAIARLAKYEAIAGVDIAGLPWVEIDFPEDLQQARQKVWPQLPIAQLSLVRTLERQAS
jgi:L-glutamine-phosphate cytidylyltransferase